MTKFLDTLTLSAWLAGLAPILGTIQGILAIVASVVAIGAGIISIILKIKNAMADGNITKEELKDIQETAADVVADINNKINK